MESALGGLLKRVVPLCGRRAEKGGVHRSKPELVFGLRWLKLNCRKDLALFFPEHATFIRF